MPNDNGALVLFKGACRGDGKIYALLDVDEGLAGIPLAAESRVQSGESVPALVLEWGRAASHVLVLPILSVSQTCAVFAELGDGERVEVARRSFNPNMTRAESALRTLRKDAEAQIARNCDASGRRGGCAVSVERAVRAEDPGFIVQGTVVLSGLSRSEVAGAVEIRCMNAKGARVGQGQWTCLKDVTSASIDLPGLFRRVVEYSVRVPADVGTLVVWASCENGDGRRIEGFAALLPNRFAAKAAAWDGFAASAFHDRAYDEWFKICHAADAIELRAQSARSFEVEPSFSIIVPLYNTPREYFCEMADSVLGQSYGKFELVLVNSTPENAELSALVRDCAARDSRVKCVELPENRGITENTNAGIQAATGDFLCFLDHDDLITPDALYCYVKGINDYPDTDLLYSDEDKIRDGVFNSPYFKPDWNPDLLTSMNYVCHFLCVRKSVVDALEPPTREFDGSQDHYMTLRASCHARNIYHARRVLYHWRITPDSTSVSLDAKPYALEAGIRAVQWYVDNKGLKGTVRLHERARNRYEVDYELESHPLVSIIIPNKDSVDMLDRCVQSIISKSTYDDYEIVIVENNSVDEATFECYERLEASSERVRVVRFEGGFNYSRINNFGVGQARGEYLLFLNNDTEVIAPEWIEHMLALCMREGTGAVGARLLFADGTIQHAGVMSLPGGPMHIGRFCDGNALGYACMYALRQDLSCVTAACMMTSRAAYERVGGFDERLAVAYNDVDFCYALRKEGLLVVYEPAAELFHYESVSRGADRASLESRERFQGELGLMKSKWPRYFAAADPYGNPNFDQGNRGAYYGANFDWQKPYQE